MKIKLKYLEFCGVLAGLVGSLLVATGHTSPGFILFTLSSAALLWTAANQRNYNLLLLQAGFLISNIIGVGHWCF